MTGPLGATRMFHILLSTCLAADVTVDLAPVTHSLEPLAAGVYAWLANPGHHHLPNMGVVIAQDGLTVIDAGLTPQLSTPLANELAQLSPLPIRRLVLSSSHIDVVGGSSAFPLAAVYGSGQTSAHLDQEPNPDVWSRLHPSSAADFTDLATRPVTHTVSEAAHLCPASIAVPLSGPQFENLAVQVPGANVVFTGALGTFGVAPLGYDADFPAWISSLDQLAGYGEIFIPANGPVGGIEELTELRNYLEACIGAQGDLAQLAAGPWNQWARPEYHLINVERAHLLASGDPSPPPAMLRLLGRL